ncbi:type II secretion system protein [Demequina sp. NBRC 110055]|uniref:type IV pilus modification PilV family protein n=1 Tax=Demequina sp. NBRC 110055 TaxID=1570344 RepID=UPI0009FF1E32|nr:type II secretion system protein [Demequina sp. NBRC 110055]
MPDDKDEGFGIAEALVSILLFGILAVALVPALILSLQVSANTSTTASASQVAAGRIEAARDASGSCESFREFLASAPTSTVDGRGTPYTVSQSPTEAEADSYLVAPSGGPGDDDLDGVLDSWCVDGTPQVLNFTVSVRSDGDDASDIADVTTLIAVPGLG